MTDPLAYFAAHGPISDPGERAVLLDGLPTAIPDLCEVIQGLLVHPAWVAAYGLTQAHVREDEVQLRLVERMLDRIIELDARPLTEARPLESKLFGNCRDHTMMLVAILRHQGVPARARCGFGAYFLPGKFEDHWVCEYWHQPEERWQLVDAQLDAIQRQVLRLDFEPTNVPRDRFVVAGQAWQACRSGSADPQAFGLTSLNEHGLWWVRDNLVRDVAALNKVELLPWDAWGLALGPDYVESESEEALLDLVAELSQRPDRFAELQSVYEGSSSLRVPSTIRSMASGGGREVAIPVAA